MNFVKFDFFGKNPVIIAVKINEIKNTKKYGESMCRVYNEIHYQPLFNKIEAVSERGRIKIEDAKELLSDLGFIQANLDYTEFENIYKFEKIKELNPPSVWFERYYNIKTFEG